MVYGIHQQPQTICIYSANSSAAYTDTRRCCGNVTPLFSHRVVRCLSFLVAPHRCSDEELLLLVICPVWREIRAVRGLFFSGYNFTPASFAGLCGLFLPSSRDCYAGLSFGSSSSSSSAAVILDKSGIKPPTISISIPIPTRRSFGESCV